MAKSIREKLGPAEYTPDSEHDIQRDADGKELSRTPKPDAATVTLRPLTDLELMDVWPDMRRMENGDLRITGSAARRVLSMGVIGWRGWRKDGKEIPFSTTIMLEVMEQDDIIDIGWEIIRRSNLSDAERKN